MGDPLPLYLSQYLDDLVPSRAPEMQLMEEHARDIGFPIIGPATGQLCYLIARLIGARRVFELGSGFGYSTAWFARAVKENGGGVVHHVVWDEELSRQARAHLATLELGDVVHFRVSEAVQALRDTEGPFDLIFNDIEKHYYPESLPVIAEKLRPGGVMIVDNMLYHGRIFDVDDQTADTEGVREFTRQVTEDARWITTLAPIRDGVLIAYRQ